jgi:hypothetical protein
VRLPGVVLLILGLIALVVGIFSGCGSLFSWNGRHAIETSPLPEGDTTRTLTPVPGRRYTVSVQVAFDREGLEAGEGGPRVSAKMPLVVHVRDGAGTSLAGATGWLDPNEPPNVLYGQGARESARGPMPELAVERLVGPFTAASAAPLSVEVRLGPDRVGTARATARRLVIYDDALPPPIRNAFIVAALGAVAFFSGAVLLVTAWLRLPRRPSGSRKK